MPLVEPPIAMSTAMAFSSERRVISRRALIPRSQRRITARPVCRAARSLRAMTAGMVAEPGSAMPIASARQHIVLAVPSIAQEPAHGSARFSMALNAASPISPRRFQPTASVTMLPSQCLPQ